MEESERIIVDLGRSVEKSIGRELPSKYEMLYSYTGNTLEEASLIGKDSTPWPEAPIRIYSRGGGVECSVHPYPTTGVPRVIQNIVESHVKEKFSQAYTRIDSSDLFKIARSGAICGEYAIITRDLIGAFNLYNSLLEKSKKDNLEKKVEQNIVSFLGLDKETNGNKK